MTIQHKDIPNAQLHEPKGISAATVDQLYVADGLGSGVWQKLDPTQFSGITTNGTSGEHILSDGAGGFRWDHVAHGAVYFNSYAAPATVNITVADTYTIVATSSTAGVLVTTALGSPLDFTETTTGRLTYTGTVTKHVRLLASVSIDQTSGADRVLAVAMFKNGTLLAQSPIYITAATANIRNVGLIIDNISTATNDYFEIYVKNISNVEDIRVYSLYITAFSIH